MAEKQVKKSQELFLNTDFLAHILNFMPKKNTNDIEYSFEHSDRPGSNTVYIVFKYGKHKDAVCTRLRISDHKAKTPYKTFLIDPSIWLSKKDISRFERTVANTCKSLKIKYTTKTINYINKNS